MKRRQERTSQRLLVKKLDRVFSEFIRLRDSDPNGYAKCCTCHVTKYWREMHAGHYVGRRQMNTRWEEQNVHAQCAGCNTFHEGRKPEYTLFLVEKYGNGIVKSLVRAGNEVKKWSVSELSDMIKRYERRVAKMRR